MPDNIQAPPISKPAASPPQSGAGLPWLSPLEWDSENLEFEETARDTESQPNWERLRPHGAYAKFGRPLLNAFLTAVSLPLVLAATLPLFLINAAHFRSFRRAFFTQERIGYRARPFKLYKLRTMSETHGTEYEAWQNGDHGRVSAFGQFLRQSHLDELPQMLNILQGNMTFLGPRPEMGETHTFACHHVPRFSERNALLPGITGLAQITTGYAGNDTLMYQRKFEQDEAYRKGYSFFTDLKILLMTPLWMLRMRGWTNRTAPVPAPPHGN